jgi:uncharacterized protein YdhG (YjbR/CyaY superfamily)
MPKKRPTTAAEYIKNAAPVAQPHLRKLHKILKGAAPKATETIKWGVPFFVEPRFIYSFSAFKSYAVLAPTAEALKHFEKELAKHPTTKNFLQIPYDQPVPEALVKKIAKWRVKNVGEGEGFW